MNGEPVEIETEDAELMTDTVPFCSDCGARLDDGKCTNAECPTLRPALAPVAAESLNPYMSEYVGHTFARGLDTILVPFAPTPAYGSSPADTGYWCSVHRLRFDTFEQMREHVRSHA